MCPVLANNQAGSLPLAFINITCICIVHSCFEHNCCISVTSELEGCRRAREVSEFTEKRKKTVVVGDLQPLVAALPTIHEKDDAKKAQAYKYVTSFMSVLNTGPFCTTWGYGYGSTLVLSTMRGVCILQRNWNIYSSIPKFSFLPDV